MQDKVPDFDELFNPVDLAGATVVEGLEPPPLWNRKQPFYFNKQERPAHRVMIELAAKGYSVKEIAEMTGYTTVCVNNILRQPPLQENLVNEIRRNYGTDEEVVDVIKESVVAAVKMLAETVNDGDVRRSDRIEAAKTLLDRRYGKPNQPINRGTGVDLDSLTDAELAAMLPVTGRTATS